MVVLGLHTLVCAAQFFTATQCHLHRVTTTRRLLGGAGIILDRVKSVENRVSATGKFHPALRKVRLVFASLDDERPAE